VELPGKMIQKIKFNYNHP